MFCITCKENSDANAIIYAIAKIIKRFKIYEPPPNKFVTQYFKVYINHPIFFETIKRYKLTFYDTIMALQQYIQILSIYEWIIKMDEKPSPVRTNPNYSLKKRLGLDKLSIDQTTNIEFILNHMKQTINNKKIFPKEKTLLKKIIYHIFYDQKTAHLITV